MNRTALRRNPRHADTVLASIAGTYILPARPAPVARYVVVPGSPPDGPPVDLDVRETLVMAVLTSATLDGVARDAASSLPPGEYAVYEMDAAGREAVSAQRLVVEPAGGPT